MFLIIPADSHMEEYVKIRYFVVPGQLCMRAGRGPQAIRILHGRCLLVAVASGTAVKARKYNSRDCGEPTIISKMC